MARKEVLVFKVGSRSYGFDVDCIQGLENYVPPTPVANSPHSVCGIVNIREEIFPVVDMRIKLDAKLGDITENTKLVLIQTIHGKIACLVDAVREIYPYESEERKEFPDMLRIEGTKYASFIVKVKEDLVIVVEEDSLMTPEETQQIQNMIEQ